MPEANIGIATGKKSGLLIVDVDPRNGGDETLEDLEVELGKLPPTVTVLTGGAGRHLYFSFPGQGIRGSLGAGVDLLGDGKLVVAPGSLHPSGKDYAFELSSEPGMVQVAELPSEWKSRILPLVGESDHRTYRESGDHGENWEPQPTPVDPADPVRVGGDWTIERAISETLPTGPGEHDRRTMDFARCLRLNLGITSVEEARPLFDRWFGVAQRHFSDPDWDTGWFKFLRAFESARVPYGASNFAARALEAARVNPLPKIAEQFRGEQVRMLVGVCKELSRMMGGRFKLSCHQIGAMFGVKPPHAWDWLRGLERAMVLKCVDRGKPGRAGKNAATFEYLGD
jgi:hypothetical protein